MGALRSLLFPSLPLPFDGVAPGIRFGPTFVPPGRISASPALTDRFMLFALPLLARIWASASSRLTGVPGTADWLDSRGSVRNGTRLVIGYPLVSTSNSALCSIDNRGPCGASLTMADGEGVKGCDRNGTGGWGRGSNGTSGSRWVESRAGGELAMNLSSSSAWGADDSKAAGFSWGLWGEGMVRNVPVSGEKVITASSSLVSALIGASDSMAGWEIRVEPRRRGVPLGWRMS